MDGMGNNLSLKIVVIRTDINHTWRMWTGDDPELNRFERAQKDHCPSG